MVPETLLGGWSMLEASGGCWCQAVICIGVVRDFPQIPQGHYNVQLGLL